MAAHARNLDGSTEFSDQRFAHPFFLPAPPEARTAFEGHTSLSAFNRSNLGPIPPVKRGGKIALDEIIGSDGVTQIEQLGEMRFHALGDSGVGHAVEAGEVADDMATDFRAGGGAMNPAFLFHLGDIVYGNDKSNHYGERFYSPYRRYPGKIIGIAGNHDGEVRSNADSPSLSAFLENFCAASATVPPQASSGGIFRRTMTLPGVYWCLEAPFVRIVGLYSNLLENPGFLEGKTKTGAVDRTQLTWLADTLSDIAKKDKKDKKALVIATHHPPFSSAGHSGSREMSDSIDAICDKAGVIPDAFMSAHAHSYQRYTRRIKGHQVPYFVVGTGGINVQRVPPATGEPVQGSVDTTYDASVKSLGYLFVTVSRTQMKFEFWRLGDEHTTAFDPFTVDLVNHVVI